jgi:hypothetical protein
MAQLAHDDSWSEESIAATAMRDNDREVLGAAFEAIWKPALIQEPLDSDAVVVAANHCSFLNPSPDAASRTASS